MYARYVAMRLQLLLGLAKNGYMAWWAELLKTFGGHANNCSRKYARNLFSTSLSSFHSNFFMSLGIWKLGFLEFHYWIWTIVVTKYFPMYEILSIMHLCNEWTIYFCVNCSDDNQHIRTFIWFLSVQYWYYLTFPKHLNGINLGS